MAPYSVRLPAAGFVGLEVEANSEEEAIQEAFEAFVIVDQIDDVNIYRSVDEHFANSPFLMATVTKIG